eukprot:3985975-Karenia_brevis.AAC.1
MKRPFSRTKREVSDDSLSESEHDDQIAPPPPPVPTIEQSDRIKARTAAKYKRTQNNFCEADDCCFSTRVPGDKARKVHDRYCFICNPVSFLKATQKKNIKNLTTAFKFFWTHRKEDGSKNAFYRALDEKWPHEATLDKDSFLSNVMGLSDSFKNNSSMQQSCKSTHGRNRIQTILKKCYAEDTEKYNWALRR